MYPFANKLQLQTSATDTVWIARDIVEQLKQVYCFDVKYEMLFKGHILISFPSGYSITRKEWCLECIKKFIPEGTLFCHCTRAKADWYKKKYLTKDHL